MEITNTESRVHHVPKKPIDNENSGHYQLNPGPNTVDADEWAALRDHPGTKKLIEKGVLVEGPVAPRPTKLARGGHTPVDNGSETARTVSGAQEGPSLSGLNEEDSLEVVANEDDVERLQSYLLADKRKPVRDAIAKRIKAVKAEK